MSLVAGCPRCRAAVPLVDGTSRCPVHGVVSRTLWRPEDDAEISYGVFVDHLGTAGTFPTYLPWPMSPGWSVTDFAVAADERTWATATCVSGTSELDGPVDVFVVAEEPGTGLGARCAGIDSSDPGREVGDGQPTVRVRIGSQSVSLWAVSTASSSGRHSVRDTTPCTGQRGVPSARGSAARQRGHPATRDMGPPS